jgi:PPK2 family polyphosphate:nucleotide phosphotransferase
MIPIVSMKSSTVIPLSAWMFLKTCSAISGLSVGADWATANPAPISMKAVIPMAASIRLDHDFVCPVSLIFAMSLLGLSKNQPAHYNPFFSSTSTHFGGDLALEEQRRMETANRRFKHPSAEELAHDFLWNAIRRLPERGRIGIFNRSYYEEVLIVRVHSEILSGEGLPDELMEEKTIWRGRYRSIVNLEDHLHRNGTRIVKFFLHLSKDEQRKRFLKRIDAPEKNWKLSLADIEERKYWKQYMKAYEACLSATSTRATPWYVVPADDKENTQLIVSRIILDAFKGLRMAYPKSNPQRERELKAIRKLLAK